MVNLLKTRRVQLGLLVGARMQSETVGQEELVNLIGLRQNKVDQSYPKSA